MTEGPGFYQGLRGRKTGRQAPRVPLRAPRRESVFAEHGLMSSGEADPNQGQLWSPSELGPRKTPEAIAREKGVAPPLASSRGGFMPGIQRSTDKATKKAKVNAINTLSEARIRTGADRGTGAPVREAMEDRQAMYSRGKPADWYQPVEGGRNVMGEGTARRSIDTAALQTRTTNEKMTRAVALTSPRTAWDEGGAPGTTDYVMPNVESARNVVRSVQALRDPSPEQARAAGEGSYGSALNKMKAKAGEYHAHVPTTSPIGIVDPSSQKVPNFEQSLHMSHIDPAIVRQAAGSYTVDAWDTNSIGGDEKMLKSDMGYAVAHMTGVRSALKNRELPPNFQASTWNANRDMAQPASMGTNRLFVSKRSGAVVPNPSAVVESRRVDPPTYQSRSQARSMSTADKYDLEF